MPLGKRVLLSIHLNGFVTRRLSAPKRMGLFLISRYANRSGSKPHRRNVRSAKNRNRWSNCVCMRDVKIINLQFCWKNEWITSVVRCGVAWKQRQCQSHRRTQEPNSILWLPKTMFFPFVRWAFVIACVTRVEHVSEFECDVYMCVVSVSRTPSPRLGRILCVARCATNLHPFCYFDLFLVVLFVCFFRTKHESACCRCNCRLSLTQRWLQHRQRRTFQFWFGTYIPFVPSSALSRGKKWKPLTHFTAKDISFLARRNFGKPYAKFNHKKIARRKNTRIPSRCCRKRMPFWDFQRDNDGGGGGGGSNIRVDDFTLSKQSK